MWYVVWLQGGDNPWQSADRLVTARLMTLGAWGICYILRDDKECSKDMLVQSVIKVYEDGGHLYSIAPNFQIHSMWGYGDVIGRQSGVTFEELFQILEDCGKDLNAIAGFSGDEPVLTRLCTVSMDEFIDWEKGTCNFEGDYFKKMLSFAKEYTGNYNGGTYLEGIFSSVGKLRKRSWRITTSITVSTSHRFPLPGSRLTNCFTSGIFLFITG